MTPDPLKEIKRLTDEIEALAGKLVSTPTYHNAVILQNRRRERDALVSEIRNKFRTV